MKHLELFDDVGYDLRPMIRAERYERKREALSEENIHTMTLQEYVEWRTLGMRFDELDDETAREKADVERRVTDLLNAGWMLVGYLQVNGNCGDYHYSQPMLKEEEEKA